PGRAARGREPLPRRCRDLSRSPRRLCERGRRSRPPGRRDSTLPDRPGARGAMGDAVSRSAAAGLFFALGLAAAACSRSDAKKEDAAGEAPAASTTPTPVRVAPVEKANLVVVVSGPGKTVALSQQKVRAPFAGTLTELLVTDGDAVRRGQAIGSMVARES